MVVPAASHQPDIDPDGSSPIGSFVQMMGGLIVVATLILSVANLSALQPVGEGEPWEVLAAVNVVPILMRGLIGIGVGVALVGISEAMARSRSATIVAIRSARAVGLTSPEPGRR